MTRPAARKCDVAVLGAGPGGYAAAFRAADLGLSVTLVDPEPQPGGVCLFRGCIPSKALLHVSRLLREAREAEAWGITFAEPTIDLARLRAWKDEVVGGLTTGLGGLSKARGVDFVRGRGVFREAHRLHVDCIDPTELDLEFGHAIVATGSRPSRLAALPIDGETVMTSTHALELASVPSTLLVVGGGYIGLELGSVYAALGSQVTVVEATGSLLPGADPDLVRVLAKALERQLHAIELGTTAESISKSGGAVDVVLQHNGERREEHFERVLVAVGRSPNSSGLGLEALGVAVDDRGFVSVDDARRTSAPSIFAIGDVAGGPMLAHKATHEGLVAAEVIAGQRRAFEPVAIPAVVFTDPEVAWCGLSQAEAESAGHAVRTLRFPWQASGRAKTLGRDEGVTKLVIDDADERVLGVGIVGVGAGELIGEAVLALEMGAVATDLAATIHAHPTLSETIMEAAELADGSSVHLLRKRSAR